MTIGSPDYPQFDDGKAPDALRTIGEVAKAMGIRQHVLRYWEEQFPMLAPVKRSGGRRYYRPEDIGLITTIDRLVHREGYTLRGARKAIEGKRASLAEQVEPAPQSGPVAPAQLSMFGEDKSAMLTELRAIRDNLAAALAAA
jgi:DNA-binding transcriptional MerR regulator